MWAKLIHVILRFCALLPLPLNHSLGGFIGRLVHHYSKRQRSVVETNVSRCFPNLSESEHHNMVRNTLSETGKTLTECGLIWFANKGKASKLVQEVHGNQFIEEGLLKGKGIILAAPHLGNWEALNIYLAPRYPFSSLYRPPRQAGLDSVIRNARQRWGGTIEPINAKGIRAMYQALARNEVIAILPDQDPRENGGLFAPFFGIQTNTMTLLSRLAQKSGATVLCTYAERLSRNRGFVIHFEPVSDEIHEKDMQRSVAALNKAVETAVNRIPVQYQWNYKRFLTRPAGEKPFYD